MITLHCVEDDEDLEDGEILEEGEVPDDDEEEEVEIDKNKKQNQINNQENIHKEQNIIKQETGENEENNQTTRKRKKNRWDNVDDEVLNNENVKKFRKTDDFSNKNSVTGQLSEDDYDEDEFYMCVRGASPTRNESKKKKTVNDEKNTTLYDDELEYAYDTDGEIEIPNNDFRRFDGKSRGGGHFNNRNRGGNFDKRGNRSDRREQMGNGGRGNMRGGRGRFDGKRGGRGNFDRMGKDRGDKGGDLDDDDMEGICQYYMQGKCHRGDNCPYSHDIEPPRKMELCKFYLLECCAKRDKCLYMHGDFPCKYFHTGLKCLEGEENNCKFSHGELTEEHKNILLKHLESAPKEILGDFPRLSREGALAMIKNKEANKPIPSLFDIKINLPEGIKHTIDKDNSTPIPSDDEDNSNSNNKYQQQQHHQQLQQNNSYFNHQIQAPPIHYDSSHFNHQDNKINDDQDIIMKEDKNIKKEKDKKKKDKEQHKLEKAKRKAERELKRIEKAEKRRKKERKKSDEDDDDNDDDYDYQEDTCSDGDNEDSKKRSKEKKRKKKKYSSEHEEEEDEGENKDETKIPSHLPKKQRELFLRIQAHQREAEISQQSDSTSDNNDDTEELTRQGHSYEHWYSSDEEGTTPLTTLLKSINQINKPASAAPVKIPLLPTPTNIPNTPGYIPPVTTIASQYGAALTTTTNSLQANTTTSNMNVLSLSTININQDDVSRLLSSINMPPSLSNPNPTVTQTNTNLKSRFSSGSGQVDNQIPYTNHMSNNSNVQYGGVTQGTHSSTILGTNVNNNSNMSPNSMIRATEQIKPTIVKRDPRLLRSTNTLDQGRPLLESTPRTPIIPTVSTIPLSKSDPMSLLKDVDLRLPTLAPLVPPPDISRDIDLRSLPFKPVPVHEACKEIDASINSHPPIQWKLILCTREPLDYTHSSLIAKSNMSDPRLDPRRIQKRRSSDDNLNIPTSPNTNVINTNSLGNISSNSLGSILPRDPRMTMSNRSDPRQNRNDPRNIPERRTSDSRHDQYSPRLNEQVSPRQGTSPHHSIDPRQGTSPRYSVDSRQGTSPRYSVDPRQGTSPRYGTSDPRQYDPRIDQKQYSNDYIKHIDPRKRSDPRLKQEEFKFPSQDSDLRNEQGRYQDTRSHDQARFQDTDLRLPPHNYHQS